MLKLILGRAGSGKTRRVLRQAAQNACAGRQTVLLVPEQFTFETERALLALAGPSACLAVEVLSFSRLAGQVRAHCGGVRGRALDACGRVLLMRQAARQVGDLLTVYRRQAASPAFARAMVDMVSECKVCGVDADALAQAGGRADSALAAKLADLSLLLRTYDALCAQQFTDTLDDITALARQLETCPYFRGKEVLLDAFKGFTAPQKQVLERILAQCDEMTAAFCTDALGDEEDGLGLFSPVKKTAAELVRAAKRAGVAVAAPERLGEPARFQNEELRALEARLFRPGAPVYEAETQALCIVSAANQYEEAQFAAQEIARLMQQEHARCGDIVVISRALGDYHGILEPVCKKYDIPLFLDARRSVAAHPLAAFASCALELAARSFGQETVLRYLKTGLAGLQTVEIARLEDYLYVWNIEGRAAWEQEWTNPPGGFGAPRDEAALAVLNALRLRVIVPLTRLRAALAEADGGQKVRALYAFLTGQKADEQMQQACARFAARGEQELADEYRQVWEKLVGLLEQMEAVLRGAPCTGLEFCELFSLGLSALELAHIPPTLDEVTAGDAERIRAGDARYVFVLGLADGVFPKLSGGGVLTDAERHMLAQMGLELSPPAQERLVEERFIAYQAFCAASQRLYLCCPRSDTRGASIQPSPYLAQVRALFPRARVWDDTQAEPLEAAWGVQPAFEQLAARWGEQDAATAALRACFAARPQDAPRLAALARAHEKRPAQLRDARAARALFGEKMHISPSRLETFGQCRFLYFCRYGMKAKPRRRAELDAPEIGTVMHFVLERLLRAHPGRALAELSEEQVKTETDALLDAFAKGFFGGLEDKPARFRHLFLRLRETVAVLVRRLAAEFAQSAFVPRDFELSIGTGGEVPPLTLPLPGGGEIAVEGQVDRVDVMQKGGVSYLRVVDYKTGVKEFNLNDVLYGLNLQMFIYLFTLCENAPARYQAQALVPAGVLYFPARRPETEAAPGEAGDTITARAEKELRMNGLLLDDPAVAAGMEDPPRGLFIPVRQKADGSLSPVSALATQAQFGLLRRHIEQILRGMAAALRAGDIPALPAAGLDYHPCDYCDYACVCGHERGDPAHWLRRAGREEIWQQMENEGGARHAAVDTGTTPRD